MSVVRSKLISLFSVLWLVCGCDDPTPKRSGPSAPITQPSNTATLADAPAVERGAESLDLAVRGFVAAAAARDLERAKSLLLSPEVCDDTKNKRSRRVCQAYVRALEKRLKAHVEETVPAGFEVQSLKALDQVAQEDKKALFIVEVTPTKDAEKPIRVRCTQFNGRFYISWTILPPKEPTKGGAHDGHDHGKAEPTPGRLDDPQQRSIQAFNVSKAQETVDLLDKRVSVLIRSVGAPPADAKAVAVTLRERERFSWPPSDPWGKPYQYNPTDGEPPYRVSSLGPDKVAGTDDDIIPSHAANAAPPTETPEAVTP